MCDLAGRRGGEGGKCDRPKGGFGGSPPDKPLACPLPPQKNTFFCERREPVRSSTCAISPAAGGVQGVSPRQPEVLPNKSSAAAAAPSSSCSLRSRPLQPEILPASAPEEQLRRQLFVRVRPRWPRGGFGGPPSNHRTCPLLPQEEHCRRNTLRGARFARAPPTTALARASRRRNTLVPIHSLRLSASAAGEHTSWRSLRSCDHRLGWTLAPVPLASSS
jgi:hypothetical protein